MELSIQELIADLNRGDQELNSSRLIDLSNLSSQEVKLFEQAWAGVEPELRRQIIFKLVELADNNFELNFDSIFMKCLKDTDAEVRSTAIDGLRECEEPSLIGPLVGLLEKDSSEKVQAAAATALGNFAMLAELKKLRPSYASRVEQALLVAVGDETKTIEVRCRALEAVATISQPQVRKSIMEAYESRDDMIKISAIYAMGKNCDGSWPPILLRELTNADARIRYKATEACGELGNEEAVPCLFELVNDSDDEVAVTAIQALGKIGGSDARWYLEQCLDSPEELINRTAKQALDELESEEDLFHYKD